MFSNNSLYFAIMSEKYYSDFSDFDEFQKDSKRGHGIFLTKYRNKLIAIPLRSGIKATFKNQRHLFCYKEYTKENGVKCITALDLSKVTFIRDEHVDKTKRYHFKDEQEREFYHNNFNRIKLRLDNYIDSYVEICSKINSQNEINFHAIKKYRYTTLVNFHNELSIPISKPEFKKELENKGLL